MNDLGNDEARISKSLASNNSWPARRMGGLTRMPEKCVIATRRDGSTARDGEFLVKQEIRVCTACERNFLVSRAVAAAV